MSDCIFCKIIAGEAPADKLYEDERVTAFQDINPVAPVHILIVPNKHLASTNDITPVDEPVIGHMFTVAHQLAEELDIDQSGYRLIINTGPDGRQVVYHLHLHLIGGHRMRFPMG